MVKRNAAKKRIKTWYVMLDLRTNAELVGIDNYFFLSSWFAAAEEVLCRAEEWRFGLLCLHGDNLYDVVWPLNTIADVSKLRERFMLLIDNPNRLFRAVRANTATSGFIDMVSMAASELLVQHIQENLHAEVWTADKLDISTRTRISNLIPGIAVYHAREHWDIVKCMRAHIETTCQMHFTFAPIDSASDTRLLELLTTNDELPTTSNNFFISDMADASFIPNVAGVDLLRCRGVHSMLDPMYAMPKNMPFHIESRFPKALIHHLPHYNAPVVCVGRLMSGIGALMYKLGEILLVSCPRTEKKNPSDGLGSKRYFMMMAGEEEIEERVILVEILDLYGRLARIPRTKDVKLSDTDLAGRGSWNAFDFCPPKPTEYDPRRLRVKPLQNVESSADPIETSDDEGAPWRPAVRPQSGIPSILFDTTAVVPHPDGAPEAVDASWKLDPGCEGIACSEDVLVVENSSCSGSTCDTADVELEELDGGLEKADIEKVASPSRRVVECFKERIVRGETACGPSGESALHSSVRPGFFTPLPGDQKKGSPDAVTHDSMVERPDTRKEETAFVSGGVEKNVVPGSPNVVVPTHADKPTVCAKDAVLPDAMLTPIPDVLLHGSDEPIDTILPDVLLTPVPDVVLQDADEPTDTVLPDAMLTPIPDVVLQDSDEPAVCVPDAELGDALLTPVHDGAPVHTGVASMTPDAEPSTGTDAILHRDENPCAPDIISPDPASVHKEGLPGTTSHHSDAHHAHANGSAPAEYTSMCPQPVTTVETECDEIVDPICTLTLKNANFSEKQTSDFVTAEGISESPLQQQPNSLGGPWRLHNERWRKENTPSQDVLPRRPAMFAEYLSQSTVASDDVTHPPEQESAVCDSMSHSPHVATPNRDVLLTEEYASISTNDVTSTATPRSGVSTACITRQNEASTEGAQMDSVPVAASPGVVQENVVHVAGRQPIFALTESPQHEGVSSAALQEEVLELPKTPQAVAVSPVDPHNGVSPLEGLRTEAEMRQEEAVSEATLVESDAVAEPRQEGTISEAFPLRESDVGAEPHQEGTAPTCASPQVGNVAAERCQENAISAISLPRESNNTAETSQEGTVSAVSFPHESNNTAEMRPENGISAISPPCKSHAVADTRQENGAATCPPHHSVLFAEYPQTDSEPALTPLPNYASAVTPQTECLALFTPEPNVYARTAPRPQQLCEADRETPTVASMGTTPRPQQLDCAADPETPTAASMGTTPRPQLLVCVADPETPTVASSGTSPRPQQLVCEADRETPTAASMGTAPQQLDCAANPETPTVAPTGTSPHPQQLETPTAASTCTAPRSQQLDCAALETPTAAVSWHTPIARGNEAHAASVGGTPRTNERHRRAWSDAAQKRRGCFSAASYHKVTKRTKIGKGDATPCEQKKCAQEDTMGCHTSSSSKDAPTSLEDAPSVSKDERSTKDGPAEKDAPLSRDILSPLKDISSSSKDVSRSKDRPSSRDVLSSRDLSRSKDISSSSKDGPSSQDVASSRDVSLSKDTSRSSKDVPSSRDVSLSKDISKSSKDGPSSRDVSLSKDTSRSSKDGPSSRNVSLSKDAQRPNIFPGFLHVGKYPFQTIHAKREKMRLAREKQRGEVTPRVRHKTSQAKSVHARSPKDAPNIESPKASTVNAPTTPQSPSPKASTVNAPSTPKSPSTPKFGKHRPWPFPQKCRSPRTPPGGDMHEDKHSARANSGEHTPARSNSGEHTPARSNSGEHTPVVVSGGRARGVVSQRVTQDARKERKGRGNGERVVGLYGPKKGHRCDRGRVPRSEERSEEAREWDARNNGVWRSDDVLYDVACDGVPAEHKGRNHGVRRSDDVLYDVARDGVPGEHKGRNNGVRRSDDVLYDVARDGVPGEHKGRNHGGRRGDDVLYDVARDGVPMKWNGRNHGVRRSDDVLYDVARDGVPGDQNGRNHGVRRGADVLYDVARDGVPGKQNGRNHGVRRGADVLYDVARDGVPAEHKGRNHGVRRGADVLYDLARDGVPVEQNGRNHGVRRADVPYDVLWDGAPIFPRMRDVIVFGTEAPCHPGRGNCDAIWYDNLRAPERDDWYDNGNVRTPNGVSLVEARRFAHSREQRWRRHGRSYDAGDARNEDVLDRDNYYQRAVALRGKPMLRSTDVALYGNSLVPLRFEPWGRDAGQMDDRYESPTDTRRETPTANKDQESVVEGAAGDMERKSGGGRRTEKRLMEQDFFSPQSLPQMSQPIRNGSRPILPDLSTDGSPSGEAK